MLLRTWILDLLLVFLSSFWRENLLCIWLPLKKELFIDVLRAILSNIFKFMQGIMVPSTKLGPIHIFMIFSWHVRQIGVANYGTGEETHLWTHSNPLIFTMRLSILNGVPTNQLSSHRSVKMAGWNFGTLFFTQGFGEEEHAWPYLHRQGQK